jgi:hypothetical protein
VPPTSLRAAALQVPPNSLGSAGTSSRYQAIVVSDEEEAQAGRLRYILSHGVKENLVSHLREWPGLHCVRQIVDGEPLTGTWYDRTQEYIARRFRGEDPDPSQFTTRETVTLSPLPCWKHLSPEVYRHLVPLHLFRLPQAQFLLCWLRGAAILKN